MRDFLTVRYQFYHDDRATYGTVSKKHDGDVKVRFSFAIFRTETFEINSRKRKLSDEELTIHQKMKLLRESNRKLKFLKS